MSEQNDDKLCQGKPLRSVYKFSTFVYLKSVALFHHDYHSYRITHL